MNLQPPSCPTPEASTRKNESLVIKALASVGQSCIATQLGVSESAVSRWKDGDISRFCKMLTLLGLKVTPLEYRCYDQKTLEAILTLAQERMDQINSIHDLAEDM